MMPKADVDGLVRKFMELAVQTVQGADVSAKLDKLVARVGETVKAQAPDFWQDEARHVRGRLKAILTGLEASEPALPNKLTDPMNQAQQAFYREAISRLDPLCQA